MEEILHPWDLEITPMLTLRLPEAGTSIVQTCTVQFRLQAAPSPPPRTLLLARHHPP